MKKSLSIFGITGSVGNSTVELLRKKKHEKTLSLKRDGDKILYQCWHCQLSGAVNMNKQPTKSTSKKTSP